MISKKCIVCGGDFEAKNSNKLYCSRSCQNKAYFERKKTAKKPVEHHTRHYFINNVSEKEEKQQDDGRFLSENLQLQSKLSLAKFEILDFKMQIEYFKKEKKLLNDELQVLRNKNLELSTEQREIEIELSTHKKLSKKQFPMYAGWITAIIVALPILLTNDGRKFLKKIISKKSLDGLIKFFTGTIFQ